METRVCPNASCGEEITPSRDGGFLHVYCQSCGYEAKESRPEHREVWTEEERRKRLGATVTPIKQGKKSKKDKEPKVKLNRDRENYVPKNRARR
jgi:DNA-directed RNA polymerase subunit M/transcription elongation factor TFIIS